MEKGVFVKDIMPNTEIEGIFYINNPCLSQSRNGPFWKLELCDASGSIEAKIWSPLSAEFDSISPGTIARIRGSVSLYRQERQIAIASMAMLAPESQKELDMGDFVPSSPYDIEEMFSELRELCFREFKYPAWRSLTGAVLNDAEIQAGLKSAPAAKSIHQAYRGGLLEHTLNVMRLCASIADQYPELDRQTLLAAALFHDIGKIREFSGGLANDYTDDGMLLGHILLGLEMLAPHIAKCGIDPALARHLKHLVLSHHGQLEFGAPKLPQTAEAFALHYADNLDARLSQCRAMFNPEETPPAWSAWQKTLDRKIFKPEHTPVPGIDSQKEHKGGRVDICLSLLKE